MVEGVVAEEYLLTPQGRLDLRFVCRVFCLEIWPYASRRRGREDRPALDVIVAYVASHLGEFADELYFLLDECEETFWEYVQMVLREWIEQDRIEVQSGALQGELLRAWLGLA